MGASNTTQECYHFFTDLIEKRDEIKKCIKKDPENYEIKNLYTSSIIDKNVKCFGKEFYNLMLKNINSFFNVNFQNFSDEINIIFESNLYSLLGIEITKIKSSFKKENNDEIIDNEEECLVYKIIFSELPLFARMISKSRNLTFPELNAEIKVYLTQEIIEINISLNIYKKIDLVFNFDFFVDIEQIVNSIFDEIKNNFQNLYEFFYFQIS